MLVNETTPTLRAEPLPGPWTVGFRALNVFAPSEKGGVTNVCDIRGWGYLTGKGHGALSLPQEEAEAIQWATARLIAAAPEMLKVIQFLIQNDDAQVYSREAFQAAREIVAKATGAKK